MKAEEFDDAAERYFKGQMDPEEKTRFEDWLSVHPEWKEHFKMNQALHDAFWDSGHSFRRTIEEINQKNKPAQTKPGSGSKRLFLILAALVLALIILWLGLHSRIKETNSQELFMAYMSPPSALSPDLAPVRAPQEEQIPLSYLDSMLNVADAFYIQGHANQALSTLESVPEAVKTERVEFQKALLLLLLDQPEEAIARFNAISTYNLSEVYWYLALCWLKLEDREKARYYLNRIEAGSRWYDKGRELDKNLSD